MKSEHVTPQRLQALTEAAATLLRHIEGQHSPAALAMSFGAEDMVLLDLVCREAPGITPFTLDTGRLNPETHDLHQQARARYGVVIEAWYPEADLVQRWVHNHGINGFYDSRSAREACCYVRKVEPLNRALAGRRAWITGQRRAQSVTRHGLPVEEHDAAHGLAKFNPLAEWSEADVWAYIRHHEVPYNRLHDQGYPSIGCAPCTRAVTVGEDPRAGRWWWEDPTQRECGLHRNPAADAQQAAGRQ
ncbi:phosphoadenylyl-sulfate reductase [Alkalilimnicola ehrlichii MLHE-1]|uniref:Adenosine 5'-phosphosulfate reductase n=1 Tax=Alkalilimnicola ehrlichii (strain ATCC BAA-1101 / DSM 17681 / MLHE-1) TaxID=187272 RepID=Q0A975_ALKEH|nr:phosphoadenylyl-sulfate reductase [Alkalilimnicola ehrlichii]ABI56612.1 phosphoadenylylsulfate reductase (thioredoxin) [Alkalilimnicola ehrlichii MLHE-1]